MLRSILREVDTNGDGRIDQAGKFTSRPFTFETLLIHPPFCFAEFQAFIDHTESGLWQMFQSIDRDHNGEIDKGELRNAFAQSGVTVSSSRLDQFFTEVDKNNDGVISYAEWRFGLPTLPHRSSGRMAPVNACWLFTGFELTTPTFPRDFLLFLPLQSSSDLYAVLSYYTATGNLNLEGDVHINDLQGLGTESPFLTRSLLAIQCLLYNILSLHALASLLPSAYAQTSPPSDLTTAIDGDIELENLPISKIVAMKMSMRYYERKLTENTPQLGYFAAGGIAGVVSRTVTAPLDRLKVYLIAQTGVKTSAIRAAKDGAPLAAAGNASKTLFDALKELWRAGGMRSLFAGESINQPHTMQIYRRLTLCRKWIKCGEGYA